MTAPTLVVSNPPHDGVEVGSAAELLGLDVFATRLKASFAAPEVLAQAGASSAVGIAVALRKTGWKVTILPGHELADIPWAAPATSMAFDETSFRVMVGGRSLEIDYATECVAVVCQPPEGFTVNRPLDLDQAFASGHSPTIAEAAQEHGLIDLYFRNGGVVRRVMVVPALFRIDLDDVVQELSRRFSALRLDRRLVGVRPRARFKKGEGEVREDRAAGRPRRRLYSFGTADLADLLEAISPELREAPQYEFGSRIAYALEPLSPEE